MSDVESLIHSELLDSEGKPVSNSQRVVFTAGQIVHQKMHSVQYGWGSRIGIVKSFVSSDERTAVDPDFSYGWGMLKVHWEGKPDIDVIEHPEDMLRVFTQSEKDSGLMWDEDYAFESRAVHLLREGDRVTWASRQFPDEGVVKHVTLKSVFIVWDSGDTSDILAWDWGFKNLRRVVLTSGSSRGRLRA